MGIHKPKMAASIRSIRHVLLHEWDPIGVQDIPEAEDEYDSYVKPIYDILRTERSESRLVEYLYFMTERMGLPISKEFLSPVAVKLLNIDVSGDERQE